MRTFIDRKQNNKCKQLLEPCSTSTLLIPKNYMELFYEGRKSYDGKTGEYLSHLLNRYRFLVRNGLIPKHEFLKTGYQEKGLDLQRVDFAPNPEDWAEMKCLKAFFNRSMTWIFVFLLVLDSLELEKKLPVKLASFVVPKLSSLRLEVRIIFSRKKVIYDKILQITRDKSSKKVNNFNELAN
ncbi:MAG: DUF1564 family protein [Leptospiraceae bacterium]|nr:DUF1564 family protein [Leptospiraceae bacterium]